MAANRFTRRQVYSDFQPLSMEDMLMPVQATQQNHNNIITLGDDIDASLKDTKQLSVHDDLVKAEVDKLSKGINDVTNRLTEEGYSPEMFREVRNLKRQRDKAFSSTGVIGKAGGIYDSYQANVKEIDSNKDMSAEDKDAAKNFAYSRYVKNKGLNEEGGIADYQSFGGTKSINYQQRAVDYANEIKAKTTESYRGEVFEDSEGNLRTVADKTVVLSAQDIQERVAGAMGNDPEVMNYMNFLSQTRGLDEKGVSDLLYNASAVAGNLKMQNDSYESIKGLGKGAGAGKNDYLLDNRLITVAGGKYILMEGDLLNRKEEIERLQNSEDPADNIKARRFQEELDLTVKEFDENEGKAFKEEVENKKSHITSALERAYLPENLKAMSEEELIGTMYDLGIPTAYMENGEVHSYNSRVATTGPVSELSKQLYNLYNSEAFKEVKNDILNSIPNDKDKYSIQKLEKIKETAKQEDKNIALKKIGKYIDMPNMLETSQEEYQKALNEHLENDVQDFKEQKTEIRPAHGNFDHITENLTSALTGEGIGGFIVKNVKGTELSDEESYDKYRQDFKNNYITNIKPVAFIKGGSYRNPRVRIKVHFEKSNTDGLMEIEMNGEDVSGTGISYSDAIFEALNYTRNPVTGKVEKVVNGAATAKDFTDDIAYQGLLASRSLDFNMTEELNRDNRFGKDKVNTIKQKLGGGSQSSLNVFQEGQGYKIMVDKKPITWGDLKKMGYDVPRNASVNDKITMSNPGAAFELLDVIGK